ncbi:MAG TPA: hypothetical protein VFK37_09045 [Bacillales bacterium]|nr:hypothetical protein [Bacillales bacterium]
MNSTAINDRVETNAQAVALANEIERAEAAVKGMKQGLKKYVDQNGPVETTDKIWGYNTSVSWTFDPESLKKVAQNIALEGTNPWELLTLPKPSLEKLGWEDSTLGQYGQKKETRRFSLRKKVS